MGRRGIKEYRAPEALILIVADRDRKALVCPSCGSTDITRTPPRGAEHETGGRVTLMCTACGRSAGYIDRAGGQPTSPEAPTASRH